MTKEELKEIINIVLTNTGLPSVENITDSTSLRKNLGFDSLKLAELTVRIEDKFDVDIFAEGIVDTVDEILKIANAGK